MVFQPLRDDSKNEVFDNFIKELTLSIFGESKIYASFLFSS